MLTRAFIVGKRFVNPSRDVFSIVFEVIQSVLQRCFDGIVQQQAHFVNVVRTFFPSVVVFGWNVDGSILVEVSDQRVSCHDSQTRTEFLRVSQLLPSLGGFEHPQRVPLTFER